jgi:hypothetical protein
VERVEFGDSSYIVFVRGENIAPDPYSLAQPNSELWALNPTNYFGDANNRERIINSLANKRIDVFGYRAKDRSCTPACLIQARETFLQPANTGFEGGFAGPSSIPARRSSSKERLCASTTPRKAQRLTASCGWKPQALSRRQHQVQRLERCGA